MATKFYDKKINVLAYCDSPTCATGFGTVSRNIFEGLFRTGRYNIDILGINYWGDPHNFPYRIWPTGTNSERDPYGRKKIANMIAHANVKFDILFFLQDTFIMDFLPELMGFLKGKGAQYKSICYFPVDGTPKEKWIKNVNAVDYVVAYTEFGKQEAKKAYPESKDLLVIPHGVNTADFYPHPENAIKEFRQNYFGPNADKFIITNLNRNQQRKDIPRTIHAFREFKKEVPESLLYLHMAKKDVGWDLPAVCESYGLSIRDDVVFPENFGPNQGYPREIVNMIYNSSDCVISTTVGEGWGLSWIEAMATRTPVIMPANTALPENITEDKGYLVRSGTNPSLYTVIPHDNEVVRPLVDVEHMVETMLHVYNNYDEAREKAENAYNWVISDLNWQTSVVPQWVKLFDQVYADLQKGPEKIIKPGTGENILETEEF
jgi:glycosyltransferase involved in cell wall biosynthesis